LGVFLKTIYYVVGPTTLYCGAVEDVFTVRVSVSVFPVTSRPFCIVANYNVLSVFDNIVAPDTFKFELRMVLLLTLKVPTLDVLPVTKRLLERLVGELIVKSGELIVAF
jgi:hypothetical protein